MARVLRCRTSSVVSCQTLAAPVFYVPSMYLTPRGVIDLLPYSGTKVYLLTSDVDCLCGLFMLSLASFCFL